MKAKSEEVTPLMQQYNTFKSKFPDAILLFRVGDFYETFGTDAIRTSKILGIVLTKRHNGSASEIELAGFPYHALDTYLPRLVRAGERVAICDQLEDPKLTKKIVKRGVTELVTPGVTMNDNVLSVKENNFVCCVFLQGNGAGAAFVDISTGEFYTAEGTLEQTEKLIQNLSPKEVLYERSQQEKVTSLLGSKFYFFKLDDWMFSLNNARDRLLKHFETTTLKGFGIDNMSLSLVAAGAIFFYLDQTHHDKIKHIVSVSRLDHDQYVWLDKFTIRNLELFHPITENGSSLCDVLDNTSTAMGSRMLKRWISMPLIDIAAIRERHDITGYFCDNTEVAGKAETLLKQTGDLERLTAKMATGRINPREIVQLRKSLVSVKALKELCLKQSDKTLKKLAEKIDDCTIVCERIEKELTPEPPVQFGKGDVIATGFSPELDEIRAIARGGKDFLVTIQQREIEKTGINTLKISFNSVFGFYIEVRNAHKDKVPSEWIRKQTLVNAERYVTPELKEYEEKILTAEDKINALETELFGKLVLGISEFIPVILSNAMITARLDVLINFALLARRQHYTRPTMNEGNAIDIKDGRHPVIEQMLPSDQPYIPNDVYLDNEEQQIIIITGPNMSGKSALLRQTALICLLAQVGSFVPAKASSLGVVDKIFTRVGASDNITQGESTFMVEMIETASILNNLSSRSLILLDEIGRGTSTYDGISIAWSISEFLHEHHLHKAKVLFATHYHELNEMEGTFKRIKNFHVTVKEADNKVIFLRKLVPGGTEHSFGIHVAEMAGMPKTVLKRAREILIQLEKNSRNEPERPLKEIKTQKEGYQLSLFQLDDPVLKQIRDEIKNTDINNLTPMEALNKLNEIKKITGL